jgi:chemotaxis protein CheD
MSSAPDITPVPVLVQVAQARVAGRGEILVALGLGSCIAILLHDPRARIAGMAHVLLPCPRGSASTANPAKFASTAVPALLGEMEATGAVRGRITARLAGGASMFGALLSPGVVNAGERNVEAARCALATARIPIVAEEVGGEHGRSVYLDPADGCVRVTSYQHPEVRI